MYLRVLKFKRGENLSMYQFASLQISACCLSQWSMPKTVAIAFLCLSNFANIKATKWYKIIYAII